MLYYCVLKKYAQKSYRDIFHFICPMIYHRFCVDFFDIFINSFFQLLLAVYTDSLKALFCHFPENTFVQIQLGAMFGHKYQFKTLRFCCEILLCFFRCMDRMVVQYKAQDVMLRIPAVQYF